MNTGNLGRTLALPAVSLIFLLLLGWMVLPAAPAGFDWDDTWYLWMAEWFSGRPEHQSTAWFMMQTRQYPPLFPLLLTYTGEVLEGFRNGLLLNALLLAAGTGVAMAWLVREGMGMFAAMMGGALFAFNPIALTFMPTLMSEPLFIFLTVTALLLAASPRTSSRMWLLIGLLAALSVATRSAGWALVAAVLVALAFHRKPSTIFSCLIGLLIGLLYLFILKVRLPEAHSYLEGYLENIRNINADYLSGQLLALWSGWQQLWGSIPGAVIALLCVAPGWLIRLRRGSVDAWYILASVGMILAWPFPEQMGRFLWVLMPAFLVAAASTFQLLKDQKLQLNASTLAILLVFVFSLYGGLARQFERLLSPPGEGLNHLSRLAEWTRPEYRTTALMNLRVRQQFILDMQRLEQIATDDSCIYSEYPALVSIRAHKVAYASPWNSLAEISKDNIGCPYYYLVPQALGGVGADDLDRFESRHLLLFKSMAPFDETGSTTLGAFFYLFPPDYEH